MSWVSVEHRFGPCKFMMYFSLAKQSWPNMKTKQSTTRKEHTKQHIESVSGGIDQQTLAVSIEILLTQLERSPLAVCL